MLRVQAETEIVAPRADVWRLVTDIENAAKTIRAIESVEVLERPATGIVGLKWRETRTMFGKSATEVMWVTDATEGSHYETRAESHGAIYTTRVALSDRNGHVVVTMTFQCDPRSLAARLLWGLGGFAFKGATRKALAADLADIKAALEHSGAR